MNEVIKLVCSILAWRDLAIKPGEMDLLNLLMLKSAFCNGNKRQNVLSNDRVFMLYLQQLVTLIALAAIASSTRQNKFKLIWMEYKIYYSAGHSLARPPETELPLISLDLKGTNDSHDQIPNG